MSLLTCDECDRCKGEGFYWYDKVYAMVLVFCKCDLGIAMNKSYGAHGKISDILQDVKGVKKKVEIK